MKKLIIEVGSTCTKLDEVNDSEIKRIKDVTIEFKRNFSNIKTYLYVVQAFLEP